MEPSKTLKDLLEENQRAIEEVDCEAQYISQVYETLGKTVEDFDLQAMKTTVGEVIEKLNSFMVRSCDYHFPLLPEETIEKLEKLKESRAGLRKKQEVLQQIQVLEDVVVTDPHNNVVESYDRIFFRRFDPNHFNHTHYNPLDKAVRILGDQGMFLPSIHLVARLDLSDVKDYYLTGTYLTREVSSPYFGSVHLNLTNYKRVLCSKVRLNVCDNVPEQFEIKSKHLLKNKRVPFSLFLGNPTNAKYYEQECYTGGVLVIDYIKTVKNYRENEIQSMHFFGATTDPQVIKDMLTK